MKTQLPRILFLFLVLGVLVPGRLLASEQSEQLVAKGYVAYDAGRYGEARDLFAQAVAADGRDADARYALGLALAKLERWANAAGAFAWALALRPDFDAARVALDDARRRAEREVVAEEAPVGERV